MQSDKASSVSSARGGKVLLCGATGTIGRAAFKALHQSGYKIVAPVRPGSDVSGLDGTVPCTFSQDELSALLTAHKCEAVMSCLTSRTGVPDDAWHVDHTLNSRLLTAAVNAGVSRFVHLSAICVQKPRLAFQFAKLAFEAELQQASITWSIVRPTAFFKSLSGQFNRVRSGKPFLVFGNGQMTACKPISDADLARFLVRCLDAAECENKILPVGGPGPAITPLNQGMMLFEALDQSPKFRHVPIAMLSVIASGLSVCGRLSGRARQKAELARIGYYYASESMLLWDDHAKAYDAASTPEFGSDTLADHYRKLAASNVPDDRGAHAVF